MKVRVLVSLKNGVLDPQGKAIEHALGSLGFEGVGDVRVGKTIDLELADGRYVDSRWAARTALANLNQGRPLLALAR